MDEVPAPADIAGTYTFYHDGWRGWLRLNRPPPGERVLTGTFYDQDITEKRHDVRAEVAPDPPHRVTIGILDGYNWMPDGQRFLGYLSRPRNAIAGWTVWDGDHLPYGFFARKTGSLTLSSFAREMPTKRKDQDAELVRAAAFGGTYRVWEDGRPGTMRLVPDDGVLKGTYRTSGPEGSPVVLGVEGRVDAAVSHQVELRTTDRPEGVADRAFHGYLFCRTANAIAGWMEMDGTPMGFYMTKTASLPDRDGAGRPAGG